MKLKRFVFLLWLDDLGRVEGLRLPDDQTLDETMVSMSCLVSGHPQYTEVRDTNEDDAALAAFASYVSDKDVVPDDEGGDA